MSATEENKFDISAPAVELLDEDKIRYQVLQEHIEGIASRIREYETKILDAFCEAYLADQSLQGKDLIGEIKNMKLTQRFFENDPTRVEYYFTLLEEQEKTMVTFTEKKEKTMEDTFNEWIMDFHKLRIQGFISETECKNIMKRITARINMAGYDVKSVGFYQYEFTQKGLTTAEPITAEVEQEQPVQAEVVA